MSEAKSSPLSPSITLTRIKMWLDKKENFPRFTRWLHVQADNKLHQLLILSNILAVIYKNQKNGSTNFTRAQLAPLIDLGTELIENHMTTLSGDPPNPDYEIMDGFLVNAKSLHFLLKKIEPKNKETSNSIETIANTHLQKTSRDHKYDSSEFFAREKKEIDASKLLSASTLKMLNKKNLAWFKNLAAKDTGHALYKLAECLESGTRDLEINPEKAINLYIVAANLGNIDAMYKLGELNEYGAYAERDLETAFHYYQMAKQHGSSRGEIKISRLYADHTDNANAKFELGQHYLNGYLDIVEKDITKGIHYIFLAAQKNHEAAVQQLNQMTQVIYNLAQSLEATGKNYCIEDAIFLYQIIINYSDNESYIKNAKSQLYSKTSLPPAPLSNSTCSSTTPHSSLPTQVARAISTAGSSPYMHKEKKTSPKQTLEVNPNPFARRITKSS